MFRARMRFGWFISGLQALSSIALLASSAWLLSRADEQPSVMYLSLAVVGVRAFALGKAFFRYTERLVLHDATFRKATEQRNRLYSGLVNRAPIGLFDQKLGSLLSNLVDDAEEAQNLDLRYRPAVIQSILVSIAGVAVFIWLAPLYAFPLTVVLISGAMAVFWFSRKSANKNAVRLHELKSELVIATQNLVSRNRVLNAYQWTTSRKSEIESLTIRVASLEAKLAGQFGLAQSLGNLTMYTSVVAASLAVYFLGDQLPAVQVAVLVLLPLAIFEYIQTLPGAIQVKSKASISSKRLEDLERTPTDSRLVSRGTVILKDFDKLEVMDASVTYPNGSLVHLPDLIISSGETVALVGKSGSGKSTLANLLLGFIQPSRGKIHINGRPIESLSANGLRDLFGLVEQQTTLLSGTVRDNLRLAAPGATDEDFVETLKSVELWQMLESRKGLETQVGERGVYLSGGEASRLALSRNLLANRQVIILDEPTAALSQEMGFELVAQFLDVAREASKTVILITHDQAVAKLASRSIQFGSH